MFVSGRTLWSSKLLGYASITVFSLISAIGCLYGDFVFDDSEAIINNKDISKSPLVNIFFNDFWGTNLTHKQSHKSYRPVTVLTFRFNYWACGRLEPWSFHFVNMTLHTIVCLLLWRAYCIMIGEERKCLWACWIFCCHPVHVEAVCGIVGRADLLAALFFLLSFITFSQIGNSSRGCFVLASIVFAGLSMLSKEYGITVLGFNVVYELIAVQRLDVRRLVRRDFGQLKQIRYVLIVILLTSAALFVLFRFYMMDFKGPSFQLVDNPASFQEERWLRSLSLHYIASFNLWLLLCPIWLSFDWSMGCIPLVQRILDVRLFLPITCIWALALILWRACTSHMDKQRELLLTLSLMLIPFLPSSNVFFRVGFVIAERVLYIPSAGFCLLVAIGLDKLFRKRDCTFPFGLLIMVYLIKSHSRSLDWRSELTLFSSALSVCPNNAKVRYNVAKSASDRGDLNFAVQEYREAIRLFPEYDQALNNLANLLKSQGELIEAERLLRRALKIRPDFPAAWMNLGIVLASLKKYSEAEKSYLNALKLRKLYPECYYNLGNLYLEENLPMKAENAWSTAIQLKPTMKMAWNNLIMLKDNQGDYKEAVEIGQRALNISENESSYHFNVANALGKMSMYVEAEIHYKRAIELEPGSALYYVNLGVLYHRWKKYALAEVAYVSALKVNPKFKSALKNLDLLRKVVGIWAVLGLLACSHLIILSCEMTVAQFADSMDEAESDFPIHDLAELDKKISCPRWVVPVLPDQELERLLIASINLARKGLDVRSEPCQRFIRDGLTVSFTKILTDEAVNSWKPNIHQFIYSNCKLLVELCVVKLADDWYPLLDVLAILFSPNNKFHTFNSSRESMSREPAGSEEEDERFARSPSDVRAPRGWLVDLIQHFGKLGGFESLRQRFVSPTAPALNISTIFALLRPFGFCCEFLTVRTIADYLLPCIFKSMEVLEGLTDEELKKEAKNESKNDAIACIIKGAKSLVSRVPGQEETFKLLENFRLKIILRLLQISSFNGKMNALNEVNKMIGNVSYNIHRHPGMEDEEWLTADRMVKWIKDNHVLEIVLRDSLHQPQYVDKLEKMLRFIIKERALTLEDLDHVWAAQVGKHEAIVKNVHDLLAKLAWDFSPEQLDHLFVCFQSSWATANKKQQEKLLELIRRLAEDDKDGVMANKVLSLFWNLAHSDDVPTDIMDQVLTAHVKILDYSCSQERDLQKRYWLDQCVNEFKTCDKWVLPALKQIREICSLYEQGPTINHQQRANQGTHRQEIIDELNTKYSIIILVSENLEEYMRKVRNIVANKKELDPTTFCPDGRYCHDEQVQERLNFMRFLLKDGQLWLCQPQAKQIWQCLAEEGVFPSDREACFKWFSKLMGEEPDLDPGINHVFFEENVLLLDPTLLTESGMKCFERFFKSVNKTAKKLIPKRRNLVMDDPDLIGMDYLWRVIAHASDEIAYRAIEIMKEVTTNLGPQLSADSFHDTFMTECLDRLKAHFDNVSMLMNQDLVKDLEKAESKRLLARLQNEAVRICRVMKVLQEYVSECDNSFPHERTILPLYRACRGKNITLTVRLTKHVRQSEDFAIDTHINETLASLKRSILRRHKAPYSDKLEISVINGDGREPFILTEDKKLLGELRVRDKMVLAAKFCPASSPESSSDSSTSCPHRGFGTTPAEDAESSLPGVILSRKGRATFFTELSDLGCELRYPPLRDGARTLLQLIPPDSATVNCLLSLMADPSAKMEPLLCSGSPTKVLYYMQVLYALLMPAADPLSPSATEFQCNFIKNGHAPVVLQVFAQDFLEKADIATKRSTYVSLLRICKFILAVMGNIVTLEREGEEEYAAFKQGARDVLAQAVEPMLCSVAHKVTSMLVDELPELVKGAARGLFVPALSWSLPSSEAVRAILKLAWAAATGSLGVKNLSEEDRQGRLPEQEDVTVAKEALQLLTLAVALHPAAFDSLIVEKLWHEFVIDLVLLAENRAVRMTACDQMLMMAAFSASAQEPIIVTICLLYEKLTSTVMKNTAHCGEYFNLLSKLISYGRLVHCRIPNYEQMLEQEIMWLRTLPALRGSDAIDECLLEGRLGLAKELLGFTSADHKFDLGSNEAVGGCLVKELIEDFILPASKQMVILANTRELTSEPLTPVCTTPASINGAFNLLLALCNDCIPNKKVLVDMLTEMFYSGREKPLLEWDYFPPLGPRPPRGFVGLKNAGATCYMNSVLQQLFMVESIRWGILAAEGAAQDANEDFADVEGSELDAMDCEPMSNRTETRKDYNIGILKQVQVIFGYLASSQLQYYTPKGLWRQFRLQGEPVNLREQQDAVEFFMSLVESVDEALKALGEEQIMTKILGGSYSDQKICKGCPHRYAKEEPFSVISVDIRNHSNLLDSLEQYVKGELLEGADAYHCDNCNKKRVTVKRLCVKKLPPVLAIQLKRFEYDFDRVCAIKFNDYFEFPRDLDMDPYTVSGLAKLEGELIDCDAEEAAKDTCTKYQLTGIVVHSGQASGGHYYSFILQRLPDGSSKWYKFDDGEVAEWKMDEEEEMRNQCFGGEYMGEVFDNMLKRTSYRRQKRWWNAYMLYYTRLDAINPRENRSPKMPLAIERGVRKQNILFLHNRSQFCPEYFLFMRKLLHNFCPTRKLNAEEEELSLLSVQLVARFLFHTGFHTKKNLRGVALEWYELLSPHLRWSSSVRRWFAFNILFQHPHRFPEYLTGSAPPEVRTAFMKILVFLAHFTRQDSFSPPLANVRPLLNDPEASLSDNLLKAILVLMEKEASERCLIHFFSLLHAYVVLGQAERAQLLKLRAAELLINAALEGPDASDKYQYPEWSKLHQIISYLIRSCDVSMQCGSCGNASPLPNPFFEPPDYIMPVPHSVAEYVYTKTGYIKKLVEDPNMSEEVIKLVQFCSWENLPFSREVILECIYQISYHGQDIKHLLDLLVHILLMEDSWQSHRCSIALIGHSGSGDRLDQKKSLLEVIVRTKAEYSKRAYHCIKALTILFSRCPVALAQLANPEVRTKWMHCVEWLQDELSREVRERPYGPNQFSYNNWSPPAQSNDSSNGYFLERSNSAKKILERALEFCPQEEPDETINDTWGEGVPASVTESASMPSTSLVNANRSCQTLETGQVSTGLSANVNLESLHKPNEGDKVKANQSLSAFESSMANLSIQQSSK